MPFLALDRNLGFHKRYGLKVDFKGGNYLRAWQTAQSGRWDTGYLSLGDSFILNDRGVKTKVVASTLYGAAIVAVHDSIKTAKDLIGKTACAAWGRCLTLHCKAFQPIYSIERFGLLHLSVECKVKQRPPFSP